VRRSTGLKQGLGDGVYADFDGYCFVLTTENGLPKADPSNTIVLEPDVLTAFDRYRAWVKDEQELPDGTN
jgi:hypothetical protein